jgi:hypothetical protein
MTTRRLKRGILEEWAERYPKSVELEEQSYRRLQEWQYLAPGPDKPSEWEFALQLLPADEALKALFEHFQLNPNNPFHWRALLDAYARDFVKKHSWTRTVLRRFAADLYVYFEQAGSWNARKAAAAMREKKRWSGIGNDQYMEKLVGDQNKIARFKEDGCFNRLLGHYDGDLFLEDVIRSRSGEELLPWEEDKWRWR